MGASRVPGRLTVLAVRRDGEAADVPAKHEAKMMTGLAQVKRSSVVRNCICYLFWLATIAFWSDPSWSQSSERCDFFVPSSAKAAILESNYEIWSFRQFDKGIQILLPLAEGGNSEAQYKLGMAYSQKKPPDDVEAFKWFLKAAEQGYRQAIYPVIGAYRTGIGVERDDQEADRWSEQAEQSPPSLKKGGPSPSLDIQQKLQWYLHQATAGDEAAQVVIAKGYESGGLLPRDQAEAARWYSKAAAKGNIEALVLLGVMYESGRGVKKDERKASALFLDGARRGDPVMQSYIAGRYEEGLGIRKDLSQAFYWYRKAVAGGVIEAQYGLGLLYILGKGVQQDQEQGWYWVKSAACLGMDAANKLIHEVESSERQRTAGVPSNRAKTLADDLQAYKTCLLEHSDDTSKCDALEKIYKADLEVMKLLLGSSR
jgi:TPR repeat protein